MRAREREKERGEDKTRLRVRKKRKNHVAVKNAGWKLVQTGSIDGDDPSRKSRRYRTTQKRKKERPTPGSG